MSNASPFQISESGVLTKYTGNESTVVIPDGVTSIGEYAFHYSGAKVVEVPEGVISLEGSAFSHAEVTTVKLPQSLRSIGEYAFYGADSLTSIHIPDSVTELGKSVFHGCSALTTVRLPQGLKEIPEGLFKQCNALHTVNFPDGLTSIGKEAFRNCKELRVVELPPDVTLIDKEAFYYCENLSQLTLSKNLKKIGSYAFGGCSALTSIDIPKGVTDIQEAAFSRCHSATRLALPEKIKKLGKRAFAECQALKELTFPRPEKTNIGKQAFERCYGLADKDGFLVINRRLFAFRPNGDGPQTVVVPAGVDAIEPLVFYNRHVHLDMPLKCPTWEISGKPKAYGNAQSVIMGGGDTITFRDEAGKIAARIVLTYTGETEPKAQGAILSIACKPEGGFDFEGYDSYWAVLSNKISKLYVALARLEYPYALSDQMRSAYETFITKQGLEAGTLLIDQGRVEFLAELVNRQILAKNVLPKLVDYASTQGKPEMTAALLSSQNAVADKPAPKKAAKPAKPQFKAPKAGSGLLGRYIGSDTHVEFPSELDGVAILGIANTSGAVPENYKNITSIVLPEGYTTIGNKAFAGCENLETIVLPSSLRQIGTGAFAGCTKLKEIFLSADINYGKDIFTGASIGTVVIEPGKTKLSHMFDECKVERLVICSGNFKSPGHVFSFRGEMGKTYTVFPKAIYRAGDFSIPEIRENGSLARNIHLLSEFDESSLIGEGIRSYAADAKAKFSKLKKKPEPLLVETESVESIDFASSTFLCVGLDFFNDQIITNYIELRGGKMHYEDYDYVVLPADDYVSDATTKAVVKANKQGPRTPIIGISELKKHMFRHDEAKYGTEVARFLQDFTVEIKGNEVSLEFYVGGQDHVEVPDTVGNFTVTGFRQDCFDSNCPFNPMPQPLTSITIPKRLEEELRKAFWLKSEIIVKE